MTKSQHEQIVARIEAGELIVTGEKLDARRMPPILAGQSTRVVEQRVQRFCFSVAEIFEAWVRRRTSPHTQRAYRQDVMDLIGHLKLVWPQDSTKLLAVSVSQVMGWRDHLESSGKSPKTINRRISSVSSFYKYLQAVAAEIRLPIVVPNPAHAQFIGRSSRDPMDETRALTATRARQLMGLPEGESIVAYRDRALIRFMLYSGVRLATACRLRMQDLHVEDDVATVRINEKGQKRRTIGLHFAAAEAMIAYAKKAEITFGPLFRPRSGPKSFKLANRSMSETGMYLLLQKYLEKLPGSMRTDDDRKKRCIYSPHSLRATTATLLLDAGVDIVKVQALLGHRHVTTTQVYDKRRRTSKESASHDVPI